MNQALAPMLQTAWTIQPLARSLDWEAEWDSFAASVGASILQTSPMASAALAHYPASRVYLGVATDAHGTAAMALLRPKRIGAWGMFEISQFPLGQWIKRPDTDLSALAAGLLRSLPDYPLLFEGVCFDPRLVERPSDSAQLRTLDHITTGAADLEDTVEAFLAKLDRDELRKIAKRERRAAAELGPVRLERLTEPSAVEAAVTAYAELESLGWKGAAGTALKPGGKQVDFYAQLLGSYARIGKARVYKLLFGDRLAAVQLAVVDGPVSVLLKSCHDETLRQLGPGLLLKRLVFESLIENDPEVKRVEFYGPYIPAQKVWTTDLRTLYHINFYRGQWAAGLHSLAHRINERRSEGAPAEHAQAKTAPPPLPTIAATLQELPADTGAILAATPFCTPDWTRLLADTALPEGSRPQFCHVPGLLLPLVHEPASAGLQALTSYYTPLFEPLTALSGQELPSALDAIVAQLAAARPRWPLIDLRPLDPDSDFCTAWRQALRRHGYWVGSYACEGNWVADTAGLDGEAYMAKRAKLRGTIRRARAKLESEAKVELRVSTVPGPELEADIDAFADIYARSWREAEPYPAFVTGLCRLAAEAGWLRLGVLRVDGEAAAAQIWLVYEGVAYIFKIAYDETHARHSVGSILTKHMMGLVLDHDRVRLIDYLVGDDAYKKRWMDRRRERIGLIAFDPRTWTGLTGALHHFGGVVWRWAKGRLWPRLPERQPGPAPKEPNSSLSTF